MNGQDKTKWIGLNLLLIVTVLFFPVYAKSALSELEQAYDDYQKAYKHYTSLVTSSKNTGNAQEALEDYRTAYTRYISLKETSDKGVIKLFEKNSTQEAMDVNGIVNIDPIIIWKKNKKDAYQLFVTDRNDRTPESISPEYKSYSAYSPINICSTNGSIVYTAGKTSKKNNLDIFYKKTLSSKPIRLLKNATALGFSPSCSQFLFRKNTSHNLYLYSFKTKKTILLYKGLPINTAAWSLDGKTIAIESQKKGDKSDIFLLSNLNKAPKIKSTNITNTVSVSEKYPFFDEKGNVFFNIKNNKKYSLSSVDIYSHKVKDWRLNEFCMASLNNNSQFLCRPSYKPVIKFIDKKVQQEFFLGGLFALWLPKKSADLKSDFTKTNKSSDQANCESKEIQQLLNKAEMQTESEDYDAALNLYRQAHKKCPMKSIEEQMAWLLSKTTSDQEINNTTHTKELSADNYRYGINVEPDQYKAFELYKREAEQGGLDAMVELSEYYEQGIWVKRDHAKAKQLLLKASKGGSISANWQLEIMEDED